MSIFHIVRKTLVIAKSMRGGLRQISGIIGRKAFQLNTEWRYPDVLIFDNWLLFYGFLITFKNGKMKLFI